MTRRCVGAQLCPRLVLRTNHVTLPRNVNACAWRPATLVSVSCECTGLLDVRQREAAAAAAAGLTRHQSSYGTFPTPAR